MVVVQREGLVLLHLETEWSSIPEVSAVTMPTHKYYYYVTTFQSWVDFLVIGIKMLEKSLIADPNVRSEFSETSIFLLRGISRIYNLLQVVNCAMELQIYLTENGLPIIYVYCT